VEIQARELLACTHDPDAHHLRGAPRWPNQCSPDRVFLPVPGPLLARGILRQVLVPEVCLERAPALRRVSEGQEECRLEPADRMIA